MTTDPLSTTFAALADPTRRAILARLALGETSVKELASPCQISAPAITKHLKVLERAGLISRHPPGAVAAQPARSLAARRGYRVAGGLPPVLGEPVPATGRLAG